MKSILKFFLCTTILISVSSCEDLGVNSTTESEDPNIIPIEQALANADALLSGLSGPGFEIFLEKKLPLK